jgi:hypothetical protein
MSAGFIGLAVSVIFLLAAVTTIVALTNRAFAGHTAGEQAHPAPATQAAPAGQTPASPGDTAPAGHAPDAH